jgi:hypothetical protein
MKLSELISILLEAQNEANADTSVILCYEQGAMEEGYDEAHTEGISDVRLIDDWPLPGKSLITNEGQKPQKLVLFYDNHYKLDSSVAQ